MQKSDLVVDAAPVHTEALADPQPLESSKPWFVYPMLAAAILAVSSAAVTFSSMAEITPFLLASWRLQLTTILLAVPGIASLVRMKPEERARMIRESALICVSGLLMGAHFGTWVMCIEHTSLTHALLVGSTPPIIIALGMLLLRKPISPGELIGTAIAAVGGVVISQSATSEKAVTLFGDCLGLIASALFVVYLSIGRTVRSWLPIFAYVLPINLIAAAALAAAALAVEDARLFDRSPKGIFGYLGAWRYFWRSLYLGAVPGIAGHVSFIALLKWLHPLLIALPGTIEPLIGSLMGLAFGIGTTPGVFTYVGGSILIGATVMVILSSYKREKAELKASKAPLATEVTLAALASEVTLGDTLPGAEPPQLGRNVEADPLLETVKLEH